MCAAAALILALAGCAPVIDAGQARTCRMVIPALNAPDAAIDIVRISPLRSGEGVRIDYRARAPAGPSRDSFVECRYAAGGYASPERSGLIGVTTETGHLGELRVHLLKRFFFGYGESLQPKI